MKTHLSLLLIGLFCIISCNKPNEIETITEENKALQNEKRGKELILGEWKWTLTRNLGLGRVYADSVDYRVSLSIKENGEATLKQIGREEETSEKMSYQFKEKFQSQFIFDVYLVKYNSYYGEIRIDETKLDEVSLNFRGHSILYFKK